MAKEPQELKWIEDLLPEDFRRRGMFGGFAYYLGDKMILATFESPGTNTYKGKTYSFDMWNGCMFPVEHELQEKALTQFPTLVSHPVLPKWLYLPLQTENFDDLASEVLTQATRPHSFWGVIPKPKSKKGSSQKKIKEDNIPSRIDTRRPRMFSDEPAQLALERAQKISDLKNLGAVSEREFAKAGIKTAQKFIQLGWKKAMLKLIAINPKNRHTIMAYALIGALTNKEFSQITEDEKQEAKDFMKELKAKELKKSPKKKSPRKASKK